MSVFVVIDSSGYDGEDRAESIHGVFSTGLFFNKAKHAKDDKPTVEG